MKLLLALGTLLTIVASLSFVITLVVALVHRMRNRPTRRWMVSSGVAFGGVAIGAVLVRATMVETKLPNLLGCCADPNGSPETKVRSWIVDAGQVEPLPPKQVDLGSTFELSSKQSAVIEASKLTVTVESVDYSPMQSVRGAELWPQSIFHLTIQCDDKTQRVDLVMGSIRVCDLQLTIKRVDGEDHGFFIVTQ